MTDPRKRPPMTRVTAPRRRALHPEPGEPLQSGRTVDVTIKLPASLWHWLEGFVGRDSFTFTVEETIVTALRCMAGTDCDRGMHGETLVNLISHERRISAAEALFGRMAGEPERIEAANILLEAAQLAAHGIKDAAERGLPSGERRALILKAWSAVAGQNMGVAIRRARKEAHCRDAEQAAALSHFYDDHREELEQLKEPRTDKDDDLPF